MVLTYWVLILHVSSFSASVMETHKPSRTGGVMLVRTTSKEDCLATTERLVSIVESQVISSRCVPEYLGEHVGFEL